MKKLTAANAAANAAAMALAATGTPHGRVPKRQAPTPPGLRDLSEAVLWAQTEAFEEASWARRAAELSDAEVLEHADAALERYDWRCSVLAELFDGVPVSEALLLAKQKQQQQQQKETAKGGREAAQGGREAAPRSLAETVRALEQEAAASTSTTSAATAAAFSSASASAAAAAAAAAAAGDFEALLSQLSRARTRAEVTAAERAYLSFRARRRRRRRGGGQEGGEGGEGEEQREQEREQAALAGATKRRTVGPGLFEILLGGSDSGSSCAPVLPDPPAGPGLEL